MIDLIDDQAGFERLGPEWDGLLQESASNCLFLTWQWLYTWWRHLAEERRLYILAVRSGAELIGIAPLAERPPRLRRLFPFRTLEFLGTGSVGSDYLDFILKHGREREALELIAEFLVRGKLGMELRQLKVGSFAAEVGEQLHQRGWRISRTTISLCPFIALSGTSWDSYLNSLGAAHRYNFKRRFKNLTKQFDVRFERARSESERQTALALLFALHQMRWRERGYPGAFSDSRLLSFHEEMSRIALDRGWLRLFVLWVDQTPVASIYAFRYGPNILFYQSGFDPAYRKHSVGLVAMGLAIQAALEEGAEEYDMLHGDEAYKFQWAHQARQLERLEFYPPTTLGLLQRQSLVWGRASRRMARRMLGNDLANRIVEGGFPGFWRWS